MRLAYWYRIVVLVEASKGISRVTAEFMFFASFTLLFMLLAHALVHFHVLYEGTRRPGLLWYDEPTAGGGVARDIKLPPTLSSEAVQCCRHSVEITPLQFHPKSA